MKRFLLLSLCVLGALGGSLLVSGCGGSDESEIQIALNWKPEPEFGGLFEAERAGVFKAAGLEKVKITGGPGAPVVQMVAAGKVAFGIASADEVVIARASGNDIVAVFTTYETCPQGIMVHRARGLKSIAEVFQSGTLAIEPGLPYTKFLERKYGFGSVKVVPYNYSIAPFLADPQAAQQCFVFSEPIAAKKQNADPQVFLIADSGYNPYTAVIITRGSLLREQPEMVKQFVAAVRQGWAAYLKDPAPANAYMGKLNLEMDQETFAFAAEAQKPLVAAGDGRIGEMTEARWNQLIDQLADLKIISRKPTASECFVNLE